MAKITKFAEGTEVPVARSGDALKRLLTRYGATGFGYLTEGNRVEIAFKMRERLIRFYLLLPTEDDPTLQKTVSGRKRTLQQIKEAVAAEERRLWRALLFVVKAKLESSESGIVTWEEEFLPYTVMPTGQTVGRWLIPQLDNVIKEGRIPPLLPG